MRRIAWPSPAGNSSRAVSVALVALTAIAGNWSAAASTRPIFGGTLRVEMSERVAAIDPRMWPGDSVAAAASERLDSLVFDRLLRLDERGTLQPAIAISWEHDAQAQRWQFRLREGVKFSDGSPLTPPVAALALQQLLGISFDVTTTPDSIVIQADHAMPDFAIQLASGRYYVFHTAADNSLSGTGPFRVAEWPATNAGTKAVFAANEICWAGRPFVDKIELTMGVNPQLQVNAISFGQADVVELPASEVRRAIQRGIRIQSSQPVELFALHLDALRPALRDTHFRQAISLACDRTSIADVILQRQGIPAGELLPNWISGYSHLFPPSFDLARAKDLLAASSHEPSRSVPLVLVYDSGDAEAQAVADRVAVNLHEAGILVQVLGQNVQGKSKTPAADVRLVRHRLAAPDAGPALAELMSALGEPATDTETIEQIYAAERAPIDTFRVIPLVHIPENYGLSPEVRDWMAPRWGGWRLEDVWLGPPAAPGGNSQ